MFPSSTSTATQCRPGRRLKTTSGKAVVRRSENSIIWPQEGIHLRGHFVTPGEPTMRALVCQPTHVNESIRTPQYYSQQPSRINCGRCDYTTSKIRNRRN